MTSAQQPPSCETVAPDRQNENSYVARGQAGQMIMELAERGWFDSVMHTSRGTAFNDLFDILRQTNRNNWDGSGALAIKPATIGRALDLLRSLPQGVPDPELVAEPTGTIAFEWQSAPNLVFSVSVREGDELAYAGLFGLSKTYGTELFIDEFPRPLLVHLGRVYPEEIHQRTA